MHRMRRAVTGAGLAFGLLTILPVRTRVEPAGLGIAAPWFPLVGALVGAGAAGVRLVADGVLGDTIAALLAVAWLVIVTGALHVDGLADCADALGVRGGRERRLAVMREPTIGTFGTLAIVLYALLLAAAIARLPHADVLATLVAAGALSRWSAVAHALAARPARRDGLGAAFSVGRAAPVIATIVAFATAIGLHGLDGLAAVAATGAVACAATVAAVRGLGGRTGDTLGATIALTELAATLVILGTTQV
jgi:adenosylcobinamide-GDP ribazoletransferase